jgi:DNA-binding beta-propeller fold protein YncE
MRDLGSGGASGRVRQLGWLVGCAVFLPAALGQASTTSPARAPDAFEVRSIPTGEFGFARPIGLTYIRKRNVLLVAKAVRGRTRVLRLGPLEDSRGTLTLPKLADPSTLSFDPAGARLTAVSGKMLVTVRSANLGAKKPPARQADIAYLKLRDPRGATFDPANGAWLILDNGARAIVRVSSSGRVRKAPVHVSLRELGARKLRGLALNPADGLLYVAGLDQDRLYGVDRSGKVRKTFSIRKAAVRNLAAMVFAPSADTTDRPSTQHLFVADAGTPSALGRVLELSLAPTVALRNTVTGRLAQTIQTRQLATPSPDPAGITYVAGTDTLLVSDSEVDEMSVFRGANLFTMTRKGAFVEAGSTLAFSREPTGLAFDPASRALYITDDVKDKVFVDLPGADGRHGTTDDAVTGFSTASFGSQDPEGVELDPGSGHLFVADGSGKEVYDINPVNGVFGDGNDAVTHFDVARYGIRNCEGIGYDPRKKTLLVLDDRQRRLFELTKAGKLVRMIDLAAIRNVNLWLASVTVAPTSNPKDSPSATNYWVADRQVDNNINPNENDGKVYEVSVP